MTKAQKFIIGGIGIAGAAVMFSLFGPAISAGSSQASSQSKAAVVESEEFVGLAGEAPHLSARYTFAVRSDGSTATVTRKFDRAGKLVASDRDLRMPHGIRVAVADHLRVVTATRAPGLAKPPRSPSEIWTPESNCETSADGLNRRPRSEVGDPIMGFATLKIIEDDSTMRLTRWFSPELGCAELRQLAEFKSADGSITDTSERRAVAARPGEPSAALFEWPLEYENLSPSEKYLRAVAHCGCAMNSDTLAALRKEDGWFHQNRMDRQR